MRQTRTYMHTLQADLEQFRRASEPPAFVDGVVPVFVNGYDFTFRFHSQLFDVLDVDARFVPREQAVFMVNEAGHVVRTRP